MIFAILPDASKAESLLNSLSEAEFNLNDVSVIMQDAALKNKISRDVGPLQGLGIPQLLGALRNAGLSDERGQYCVDAVSQGKVLVVMKVDPKYESAAREMFQDVHAEVFEK